MTYSSPSRTARHCKPRQVGAGLGLGEAQREGDFAADDAGRELLLLLLGAGGQDGRSAGAGPADGDAGAGEFLFNDVLVDAAAGLPAVLLGPRDANPAPFGDVLVHFAGFGAAPADAGALQLLDDLGSNVFCDELLDFSAEGFLFRSECEFHNYAASHKGCGVPA